MSSSSIRQNVKKIYVFKYQDFIQFIILLHQRLVSLACVDCECVVVKNEMTSAAAGLSTVALAHKCKYQHSEKGK